MEPPQIKKLEENVINRIAAGEVIQRPANAIKEMIENSLDAKANNIQITVKNGGLKFIQIQDNGTGIRKEDFEIVCQRFTTSKLREFEDLNSIMTYGFRGEALASISHIAHLTIQSKTANEKCAYRATFGDGKVKEGPKAVAGNQGTQINVEDLFYNMNIRKNALKNTSEEYQKISDVVGKYAVHNATVGFGLKKFGENNDIRTPVNSNHVDNIRTVYGNFIARELIEFSIENESLKFKAKGYMTNVNYSTRKFMFLLFINNRLVDCAILKKCIDHLYSTYLPKNMHPFVYLSLEIEPQNVDVNVHPTKHEVHFLHEEQIVENICTALETKLLGSNNSRMFYTQAKLPKITVESIAKDIPIDKPIYAKDLVRTDYTEQKLDKFFKPSTNRNKDLSVMDYEDELDNKKLLDNACGFESDLLNSTIVSKNLNCEDIKVVSKETKECEKTIKEPVKQSMASKETKKCKKPIEEPVKQSMASKETNECEKPIEEPVKQSMASKETNECEKPIGESVKSTTSKKTLKSGTSSFISRIARTECKLTSVLELRKQIELSCHTTMRELFAQHVFVGCVDSRQTLIQHGTKLYLCNTRKIMQELFYQFVLYNFGNFKLISLSDPLPIYQLALIALDLPETGWTEEDGDKKELATKVTEILTEKGEMLFEYFGMEIDEHGYLKSIPLLLENHIPEIAGLPMFALRLATEVQWDEEKQCFNTLAKEIGTYYSTLRQENTVESKGWSWTIEHLFYPAIKEYFLPPKVFTENAAVLQIADLPNLYKVFERC